MSLLLAISLLEIDLATGNVVRREWEDTKPVPIGSLAKPFIALAYAQRHGFVYPRVRCKRCWKPDGHGEMEIVPAIAQSCNTYFDALRQGVPEDELRSVALRFGLEQLDRAEPEKLLRAYVELHRRAAEPGVASILEGMRKASASGTAKALGRDAYAKTGTAACTHRPRAPGDGFAVVLAPAPQPRTAILVRVHGAPGSVAVKTAGKSAIKNSPSPNSICPGCSPVSPRRK
ncbi:MAG: hypothetical protein JNL98_30375 [Bryobacterales bacterium]|nr:hypothetical protein [Bryobacterales bacterium]